MNRKREKVERQSADIAADRIQQLKQLFPEAAVEGRIDFDNLRLALGEEVDSRSERYSFTWAGKRDAIRMLQTPSRATLVPCPDESVNFETTNNVFIEGENLEVLKLLYKSYAGRVKMIYIDPPYNTGNDFIYPDDFADPLDRYLRLTGQKNGEGDLLTTNPETNGRYHSAWLSMMYPRLFIARQLLREDGVIFVSIDDHEVHSLRLILNEVFGEENFVAIVIAQTNPRGRTLDRFLAKTHEYVVVYARDAAQQVICQVPKDSSALKEYNKEDDSGQYRELELRNRNPVFDRRNRPNLFYPFYADPKTGEIALECEGRFSVEILPRNSAGEDGCWTWGRARAKKEADLLVARLVGTGAWRVFRKDYIPSDGATTKQKALWLDKSINYENGKEELGRLFGRTPFDFPKSVGLVLKCLIPGASAEDDDIVLDFFAGSCTTAQAVLELNRDDGMNRRLIVVQLPEPTQKGSVAQGMGLSNIADIGKERIRRVIKKLQESDEGKFPLESRSEPEDLGFKVFKLSVSNFKPWTGVPDNDPDAYTEQMALYVDPLVDGWKPEHVILEAALREGYSLTAKIELVHGLARNRIYLVSDPDKGQRFHICLDDSLNPDDIMRLKLTRDDLFICRDSALDDEKAANLALQCRLKTI